ncbi:hypothetical protein C1H46_037461 [Malus baccata]|uniref:Uncharacterized protein n=1 Tax=Malus baccata TaxID=106549 RepID=A0A540KS12_MALBA|nr:hypothetical protein C1H46_037461 [Malus baccata]
MMTKEKEDNRGDGVWTTHKDGPNLVVPPLVPVTRRFTLEHRDGPTSKETKIISNRRVQRIENSLKIVSN